jgi:hypothetical protein
MHYLSKIFSAAKPTTQADKVEDVLEKLMPEDMQEEMFCFTMGNCELHQIKPRQAKGAIKQTKECLFMKASIHLTSMLIDEDEALGTKINIPLVVVSNDGHEED